MKKITVEKNSSGLRIDKFLVKEFFSYTRGEIIRQIKSGNILVNSEKIKPSYILKENDIIEYGTWNMEQNYLIPNPDIKIEIIYEDKNIIVINKPAGLQVHPDFHERNNTLVNGLIAKFPEIVNVGDPSTSSGQENMRPGIVHRLDKDTSGVMVVARNQENFDELKKKFKNREVEKTYLAIVYGKIDGEGTINKAIARASNYKKQIIAGRKTRTRIRSAVTQYKRLKEFENYSLAEVFPKTGRTHQIRVHLNSIGHPVVGDNLYKQRGVEPIRAERQLLHAKSIKFELFGRDYFFEADMPHDFQQFLTRTS